jgi:hypothetical protein
MSWFLIIATKCNRWTSTNKKSILFTKWKHQLTDNINVIYFIRKLRNCAHIIKPVTYVLPDVEEEKGEYNHIFVFINYFKYQVLSFLRSSWNNREYMRLIDCIIILGAEHKTVYDPLDVWLKYNGLSKTGCLCIECIKKHRSGLCISPTSDQMMKNRTLNGSQIRWNNFLISL